MPDIGEKLLEMQRRSIKEYRLLSESGSQSAAVKNRVNIQRELSQYIANLKLNLEDVLWRAIVNNDPIYKRIVSKIEENINNPDKQYCYIDERLENKELLELYVDAETAEYIKTFKPLFQQIFNIKERIVQHDQGFQEIDQSIKQEILNGKKELTPKDIKNQKKSNKYINEHQKSERQIEMKAAEIRILSAESLRLSDKTERQIEIEKIIKVLRSEIKKLNQELYEFLVKLAQDSNPHKTYISHDYFEIIQESHPKYKDYQRIKIELDGKEKCLKSQAALLKERFNEFLKDGHHLISSIKDRELKQKLAKEAGRLSKSPLIPFYKLREYITPNSFVILPGQIFEETKDSGNQNACISKDEKNQFLESGEYIINCGVFGAVSVSVKAKRNQKFFHCEFLSDSVKIDNFNDEYIAIINHSEGNYRLTFQLTKIVLENTIELSLNLNKIGDSSQHYQFTICSKNTIQEQQFRDFFNPYTKS